MENKEVSYLQGIENLLNMIREQAIETHQNFQAYRKELKDMSKEVKMSRIMDMKEDINFLFNLATGVLIDFKSKDERLYLKED